MNILHRNMKASFRAILAIAAQIPGRWPMFLLLVTTCMVGCDDQFDYRHKYTGAFQFHAAYSVPPFGSGDVVAEMDYDGHVFLGDEGQLKIHWAESRMDSTTVNEAGTLQFGGATMGGTQITGSFSNRKKLSFRISNYDWDLTEEFERWDITGERR